MPVASVVEPSRAPERTPQKAAISDQRPPRAEQPQPAARITAAAAPERPQARRPAETRREPTPSASMRPTVQPAAPAAAPAPASAPTSAMPGSLPQRDKPLRLLFEPGEAKLSASAKDKLHALAATMKTDDRARLQLRAYAQENDRTASAARRLSLSRALAVRSFLIAEGVLSTRMDVRALGSKYTSGPGNHVDLIGRRR